MNISRRIAYIRLTWMVKVGTVLLVGQIWDAITTPIIGYLTDNIHTRWGRRKVII